MNPENEIQSDVLDEGRQDNFMDIDRMINEGLGGGTVVPEQDGLIEETTTDTMDDTTDDIVATD